MATRDDMAAIAERHGFGAAAIEAARAALNHGGGRMAQFSHPELGGMGQWSPGMTMIGTMSDRGLKDRVAALFADLAALPADETEAPSGRDASVSAGSGDWWPGDLGRPSSTGAQNDMRYALFPDRQRLAIQDGETVKVYDTGRHRISGFGQQGGGARTLTLSGEGGSVSLDDLAVVPDSATKATSPERPNAQEKPTARGEPEPQAKTPDGRDGDAIGTLERLSDLHDRGILSDTEFAAKKADLLSRI